MFCNCSQRSTFIVSPDNEIMRAYKNRNRIERMFNRLKLAARPANVIIVSVLCKSMLAP
jgi:hypothetical protein